MTSPKTTSYAPPKFSNSQHVNTLGATIKDMKGSLQENSVQLIAPTSAFGHQLLRNLTALWDCAQTQLASAGQAAQKTKVDASVNWHTKIRASSAKQRFQKALDQLTSGRLLAPKMAILSNYLLKMLTRHPELATTPLKDGTWALHLAIKHGQNALVDKLLDLGAGPAAFAAAIQQEDAGLLAKIFEAVSARAGTQLREANPQAAVEDKVKATIAAHAPPYRQKYASSADPLLAALQAGDTEAFVQQLMDGADYTALNGKGQSLLHLAAIHHHKQLAWCLLLMRGLDAGAVDQDGKTFRDLALANGWTEFIHEPPDPAVREQLSKDLSALGEIQQTYLQEKASLAHVQTIYRRGYVGHNPLLVKAIQTGNIQTFVRLIMDGASLLTLDQHGRSLLHLAAVQQNKQMAMFLLSQGINPALPDNEGTTFDQLAKANAWHEFLQADPLKTEPLKTTGEALGKMVRDYETARLRSSEEVRKHQQDSAWHGSAGHNLHLIACLAGNNLKHFIEAVELGAAIDTVDDNGYSLLHYAVDAGNLEIMDYLLLKYKENDPTTGKSLYPNLNPSRSNHPPADSSATPLQETPIAMAIRQGNFAAMCLLLTQGDTRQTFNFTTQHKDMQAALQMWKKVTQLRDPLHVTVQEKGRLISALCALMLAPACAYGGLSGFSAMNLSILTAVLVEQSFQKYYAQDAIAEYLVNPPPAVYIPEVIKKVYTPISHMALAEMLSQPSIPLATITSMGINTLIAVTGSLQALGTTLSHAHARAPQACIKAAVNLAPTLKSMFYFGNLLSTIWPADLEAMLNQNALTEKYLQDHPEEAENLLHLFNWRRLDRQLQTTDQANFNASLTSPTPALDSATKIQHAWEKIGVLPAYEMHMAKSAKEVLLNRVKPFAWSDTSSWQFSGTTSLMGKTAISVGLAVGMHQIASKTDSQFLTVAMATMGLYNLGRWGYSKFWAVGHAAPPKTPPLAEKQKRLALG